ncbi:MULTISPECIES: phosphatidylserine decarboxylase family protein [Cellulophaga]|uniref:Phosphatidylserine decarboxylase proenzyme n=2 Tax=Cellulophaga TaxID=104264 RepID=F0RAL8_CELLC|nr:MULTISPECIES: phosphatidylserine decarboxylase family protein [Cellulophaga]ADY28411.1 Phosphatidylserine decarboxylase proenzyme [Cellulophaga lytica DSM 7489]AIM59471.1 phosphatidylserine decarboxylase [Cellulophaga lytica]APU09281.1 phosphatidylserine decarboxylase [Cellulophaga lytica]EWH12841.1 phosphatidylserine decarboxylase proenzyme [Cellulophaga geojensis KL-A]MDO6854689.1 phosphatidylserine decarboxylase family protein [Cellulophaga lytica]
MFHKEGQKIIIITFILVVAAIVSAEYFVTLNWLKIGLQVVALVFLILILQFFRNPKRKVKRTFDDILAPVDGKVVVIEEVEEPEYFKGKRKQISIFMSPVNVHVTRYAASGSIKYSKYHPGKYLVAWHPKASTENERTTVVINTPKFGDILYRQIAGALAKRIVNYAKVGDSVHQGEDAGFIKFGSRVDIFLPLDTVVTVKLNQKVIGAKTCIATLPSQND